MTKIVMENTSGSPVDTRYVPSFTLTIKKGTSTRASHLVLRNVELFQEILRYLPVHPSGIDYFRVPDRENCYTLARLARVCKAFCDPTLATLWCTSHIPALFVTHDTRKFGLRPHDSILSKSLRGFITFIFDTLFRLRNIRSYPFIVMLDMSSTLRFLASQHPKTSRSLDSYIASLEGSHCSRISRA